MELPEPDPETVRLGAEMRIALARAVAVDGDVEPAFAIAASMVARRLVEGTAASLVAMNLFELSLQRYERTPELPDPFAELAHHLVAAGRLCSDDLTGAVHGRILNTGLTQGWLDAELYDALAGVAGQGPLRALLAKIERRPRRPVSG